MIVRLTSVFLERYLELDYAESDITWHAILRRFIPMER